MQERKNFIMPHFFKKQDFKNFFYLVNLDKFPAGRNNLLVKLGACFLMLIVLTCTMKAVESSTNVTTTVKPQTDKLKVVDTGSFNATVTVSDGGDMSKPVKYELIPNCPVLLNQGPVKVSELKQGDEINLKINDQGDVSAVDAYRTTVGIVSNSPDNRLAVTTDYLDKYYFPLANNAKVLLNDKASSLSDLRPGDSVIVYPNPVGNAAKVVVKRQSLALEFWENFRKNLFKPLLLFFYLGFAIPLLKVSFEFPYAIYQGLTIYLLIAIGWHGGEELADAFWKNACNRLFPL